MSLSWNEIESRAAEFASRWQGETYEKGESQSFWSDFLQVFGVDRRRYGALFEYAIKKNGGSQGFIDLFWPGKFLAEQKSGGRDLEKAGIQARDYLHNMPDYDLPLGIAVSDFATFEFTNQLTNETTLFTLEDLPKHVKLFGFLIGEQSKALAEQDPVNRQAAEAMARLHNQLRDDNYTGHDLELLLVRLVFCLFADDSGIFERGSFEAYLNNRTSVDGSDFGPRLVKFFEVLNTPEDKRQSSLDQDLAAFPYINGGLFDEPIRTPDFNSQLRADLLASMELSWESVSPAIFGSMFQGVMDAIQRRNLGAHYTSEANILKVIKPLFLDGLYEEFSKARRNKTRLAEFHDKLASLTFLDPACGCGNFLVITYRELRRLEHKVIDLLYKDKGNIFDASGLEGVGSRVKLNVDQMNGIEIEEFPALIAQTALWLTDHQMNLEFSKLSGTTFKRLPLTKSANIVHANALTTDWAEVIAPQKLSYILGNPPFIGSKMMVETQRTEIVSAFNNYPGVGVLDFVSAWYAKALVMMEQNKAIQTALVSTNSITQGEQVGVLWKYLIDRGATINFAHRTFKWTNDAKGNAAVFCVIVGFGFISTKDKWIFEYPTITSEPVEIQAKNINPYLIDAPTVIISSRSRPISDVPSIKFGNQPIDGGGLIFSTDEREAALESEPALAPYIRRFIGSQELINGGDRFCLWLGGADLSIINNSKIVRDRLNRVRSFRLNSSRSDTRKLADSPSTFAFISHNERSYIAIPSVSSERRLYIPMTMEQPETIASNLCLIITDATMYHFGILNSQMHMSWTRAVCGRLKSDYRYSNGLVYNNFIWPENVTNEQKANIEQLAQAILDTRSNYPNSTLADLYDPLTMPPDLLKAHKTLDKTVDKLYCKEPFADDAERVGFLLDRYKEVS